MITPTQEDRQAYIDIMAAVGRVREDLYGDAIKRGEWDHDPALQLIAQHAARAAERMREGCAEVVVDHCRACNAAGKEASFLDAVAAIRAIPTTEAPNGLR